MNARNIMCIHKNSTCYAAESESLRTRKKNCFLIFAALHLKKKIRGMLPHLNRQEQETYFVCWWWYGSESKTKKYVLFVDRGTCHCLQENKQLGMRAAEFQQRVFFCFCVCVYVYAARLCVLLYLQSALCFQTFHFFHAFFLLKLNNLFWKKY